MTRLEDRQALLHAIKDARAGGARLAPACALAGIDPRTEIAALTPAVPCPCTRSPRPSGPASSR
jgi:hypothetical protein